MLFIDPDGRRTWFQKIGDGIKNGWDWFWGKANDFAQWAEKNGVPSANFGADISSGGEVNPLLKINGQQVDFNYGSENRGMNNAVTKLNENIANLPVVNIPIRHLDRGLTPVITVGEVTVNWVAYADGVDLPIDLLLKAPKGYSSGEISSYKANFFERIEKHPFAQNLVGRTAYNIVDNFWVTSTSMALGHKKAFHLNGSYAIGSETVGAGINTFTNFVPATKFSSTLKFSPKVLNAAQFNTLYKNTGITAAKNGGIYIRQFNNGVRQANSFNNLWKYISTVGLFGN